ncbi:MAG: hypothetical protein U5K72_11060 [Balneolaceae bacterium]|nr:hypothetical protein [Balneolaceae bacterium]
MNRVRLDYTNSSIVFVGLLLISIVAFWPTYFAVFFDSEFYIHLHVFFAVLWFGMLIVQPYLIKSRRLDLHRFAGKISYLIAPFVVISIGLLAHNNLIHASESFYPIQTYILYLQLSLAFLFAITYGCAVYYRKTKAIHSRCMIATSFTFIDPIFARLFNIADLNTPFSNQVITFMLVNLILVVLSILDRNNRKAKWVYPSLLILYLIIEIPIFFNLTGMNWWQSFAEWFGSL